MKRLTSTQLNVNVFSNKTIFTMNVTKFNGLVHASKLFLSKIQLPLIHDYKSKQRKVFFVNLEI